MGKITTEEAMDKLDMYRSRFRKIDEFSLWYLEIFSADAGMPFTSTDTKKECQTRGVHLNLVVPEYQESNGHKK